MTTKKAVSIRKKSRKNKKDLIKDVNQNKKSSRRRRRNKRNKTKSSNLSNLYTYESPVTNKTLDKDISKLDTNLNVNVIHGLKDYLAVKK
jgi:hypothetical protein